MRAWVVTDSDNEEQYICVCSTEDKARKVARELCEDFIEDAHKMYDDDREVHIEIGENGFFPQIYMNVVCEGDTEYVVNLWNLEVE